jgi:hypothetical protein
LTFLKIDMFGKYLTKYELGELQELDKLIRSERLKRSLAKDNTILIHNGKEYVKTQDGLIQILENQKGNMVAHFLKRLGYPQGTNVQIDLATGRTWTRK